MYLSISLLYTFRATQCSSSGESIVSIHHPVYIILCRWLRQSPTQSDIPDDVLIQLILLMMITGLLETCREVKWINTLEKCVKLVINKNYTEMHRQRNIKFLIKFVFLSSKVAKVFLSWKKRPPNFTTDLFCLACKEEVVRDFKKSSVVFWICCFMRRWFYLECSSLL
jgi:hypothetical protein